MSNAIQVTKTRRAVWDGRQFAMERFNPGGKEATDKNGDKYLTEAKWESEQKYFTGIESVVEYAARTEAAETANDLREYVSTMDRLVSEISNTVGLRQ